MVMETVKFDFGGAEASGTMDVRELGGTSIDSVVL